MMHFSCANCGMKFKVKTQYAGRSTQCPTCKHVFVIPSPGSTDAQVAAGEMEGSSSSLASVGIQGGVNLATPAKTAPASQKSVRELLARRSKNNERYIIEQEMARGGMGAVLRAIDCDIRREVAVKYLLDQSDPRKKLRFIEEAQITGQLEHPNIVPIHELGTDAQKRLFFSMKMVRGKSLAQVLADLKENPKTAEKIYSLSRLLNILINIGNALAYAHSCGVIHRDIKPANIMLGDFGEVYVMDWGLAKVLHGDASATVETAPAADPAADALASGSGIRSGRSSKVVTSREPETDLTQDGIVVGTPVYMPPEQASGKVQAVDQRSDLYSLGAILYEMLTLQPPIAKIGSYMDILMRAMKGEIVPPELRNPQRAKAGRIPPELSAIAMKALALRPEDRYPSVESFRHDLERFQEGRSVSAKHDTVREFFWKLVKRNMAVSMVATIAIVLLTVVWGRSAIISHQEQSLRRVQSVPAFIEAAHFALQRQKFDQALVQISLAVEYDNHHAEAQLLKGQLLIVLKDFKQAQKELQRYLELKPADADAARLLELVRKGTPGDATTVAAIAEVLRRQNAIILAAGMVQAREQLATLFRQNIEAAWPGLGGNLKMDKDGSCTFVLWPHSDRSKITSLTPLQGIPLTSLDIRACSAIKDLTPLQGMPLTSLNLENCSQIKDLLPLQGMPLTNLVLSNLNQLKDLTPLQGMSLITLNLSGCGQIKDLSPLHGMPLTNLSLWGCGDIKDIAPLQGMKLTSLNIEGCGQIKDLTALRGMRLTNLNMAHLGQIRDLTALQSMPLTSLSMFNCGSIKDLSPLQGMPLRTLDVAACGQIQDLKLVRDLPLTTLYISRCNQLTDLSILQGLKLSTLDISVNNLIKDLNPLKGMPLTNLNVSHCSLVRDLTPLKGMKFQGLDINNCNLIDDLTPLQGMQLNRFSFVGCPLVKDLTPLQDAKINEAYFTPRNITKGIGSLRQMRSLYAIGIGGAPTQRWGPQEFWKRYDAGEFK